ncbi:MAG: thiolase family protein [Cycloclasticus sp.]|jgi:acetyl-CoA acetyltransferase|uniref:thiolase family protein n=1 Tax=Cycloclasticus sp. TaxID=2024830 RepID=UPI00258068E1|nr:thiolase family protein [Cycloclasticus sp.]MBV1899892.1 thiolase family protein [Cycloclasticus sp.]
MSRKPLSAVTGIGMTELRRDYTVASWELAVEAIGMAISDAGLKHHDIDGLLINKSPIEDLSAMPMDLQDYAGLRDLSLLNVVEAEGSSMVQTLQQATMAIQSGLAKKVVCVFADTPLQPGGSAAESFAIAMPMMGKLGTEVANGFYSAIAAYAMAAQRYLAVYNRTTDDLAAVAIANREWARLNPLAKIKKPMTMADHHASPWLVEPLRMLDCAYPVNGAIAVVVSDVETAKAAKEYPAYIYGMGQGHKGNTNRRGYQPEIETGAKMAAQTAFKMAGVTVDDIDACEFYDAFSISTLINLEMYGFCEPGKAAQFIAEEGIGPGEQLPVNTGGGHLSGYYMQGATAVSEAVMQLHNRAEGRQLNTLNNMLVTGYGGRMQFHAALVMGR